MSINYNIRKRPYIFHILILNLILISIYFVLNIFKVDVLVLFLVPFASIVGLFMFKEYLIFDYHFLKWYERMIKKKHKIDDLQFFTNQIIQVSFTKDLKRICFKKMGYYTEEDLKKMALLLIDFFPEFEFSGIEEVYNYNVISYTPKRERIDLKNTQISDLIFPANAGYSVIPTFKIDSGITLKLSSTLISGKSGSGKSMFIQKYYYPVLHEISQFHIIDVKNTTPDEWKEKASSYTSDSEAGLKKLNELVVEMKRRYADNSLEEDALVLVFEEVQAFKLNLSSDDIKEFNRLLKQILVLGREARVFIFFISQTVNVGKDGIFDTIGMRDQFQVKYNLGDISMEQSQQIFGVSSNNLPKRFDSSPGSGYVKLDDDVLAYRTPLA